MLVCLAVPQRASGFILDHHVPRLTALLLYLNPALHIVEKLEEPYRAIWVNPFCTVPDRRAFRRPVARCGHEPDEAADRESALFSLWR